MLQKGKERSQGYQWWPDYPWTWSSESDFSRLNFTTGWCGGWGVAAAKPVTRQIARVDLGSQFNIHVFVSHIHQWMIGETTLDPVYFREITRSSKMRPASMCLTCVWHYSHFFDLKINEVLSHIFNFEIYNYQMILSLAILPPVQVVLLWFHLYFQKPAPGEASRPIHIDVRLANIIMHGWTSRPVCWNSRGFGLTRRPTLSCPALHTREKRSPAPVSPQARPWHHSGFWW